MLGNRKVFALRVGVAVTVIDHLQNGLWAMTSPEGYNQALPSDSASDATDGLVTVLVRDVGAGRLALAFMLTAAVILLDRRLVLLAPATATVAGLGQLAAHLISDTADRWTNWIGLLIGAALPIMLFAVLPPAAQDRGVRSQ